MKNLYRNFLIPLCFFCSSCDPRNIDNEKELNAAKADVMLNGDDISYMQLTNYYDKEDNYQDILPYSIKMMKTDSIGYSDFYHAYLKISFNNKFDINNILKLDKQERDFLILILNKGAISGDPECKEILAEYFKKGIVVEKNISKADSIYKSLGYFNNKKADDH